MNSREFEASIFALLIVCLTLCGFIIYVFPESEGVTQLLHLLKHRGTRIAHFFMAFGMIGFIAGAYNVIMVHEERSWTGLIFGALFFIIAAALSFYAQSGSPVV